MVRVLYDAAWGMQCLQADAGTANVRQGLNAGDQESLDLKFAE